MEHPNSKFRGTGVAVVTPFLKSGEIDYGSYGRILDHFITNGVEYIVVMGTTGETPTLSKEEKKTILDFSVRKINARVPVVVGIGGNNTTEVVHSIAETDLTGVDAILSVSPYYNKPTQQGIFEHFTAIAGASPVPVILYTVPGRTGGNIMAETTLKLAASCANIIGIKEASGNIDQVYQVLKNRPEGFLVISGDDNLTLPYLAAGADGVISVVANAYPKEFSEMVRAGLKGDFYQARQLHFRLLDFMGAIFADGSPGGIKAALEARQLCGNFLRLPLVPVNETVHGRIRKIVEQLDSMII
jgi:4-hydroxy-tetrahydrodipicolinate synthase